MRGGKAVASNLQAEVVQALAYKRCNLVLRSFQGNRMTENPRENVMEVNGIVRPHPGLLPQEKENRFQFPSRVEPSIARVRFPDQISSWPKTAFVCQEKVSYVSIF
jgi:hypothetical protein